MKTPLRLLVLTVALTALLSAAPPDKAKLKQEVAAMEDQFCAMTKERGILAAFEHFAAPDVSFIDTDPRRWRGPAAVRERIGPDQPGVTLSWSASYTDVSDDGTLGYNYGRYEYRAPGKDGKEHTATGWFLTIWKRQPDGSWRYVMDNGVPDPKPAAPAPAPEKKE
ncbi:MAG: YybH family protein [Opitutales bacterium]